MAKHIQKTDDNEILHKATAAIYIDSRFSFAERKLFNVLLWNAQENRYKKGIEYSINTDLLLSLIKWDRSKNITRLQEIIEKFTVTSITWNEGKRDKSVEWGVCTFLQGGRISGSKTFYRINDYLSDKLLTPNVFAKIMLQVQTQFSSKYSLILYEYLIDELSRKKAKRFERDYSLENICDLLDYQGLYKHLNNDILKRSQKEINKYTEIDFNYEGIKQGRKVAGLRFIVGRKELFQCELQFDGTKELALDEKQTEHLECLVDKGVSKRQALKLVQTFDSARVAGNLRQVSKLTEENKIKNVPAYLVKAIEEDYRPQPALDEPIQTQQAAQTTVLPAAKRSRKALEKEWQAFRQKRVETKFQEQPEKWRNKIIKDFEKTIKTNKLIWAKYLKDGLSSGMVSKTFYNTIQDVLLTEDIETNIEAFRLSREKTEFVPSETVELL